MSSFEKASQDFLAWLSRTGAKISQKIALQDLRNIHAGRGVVAVQDIEEEELLFRVPRSAILSVENSILSKEIPSATFESLGPWLSLILVMLYEYENKDASNWAPYFNVLPTEFNTLMFWEKDELEQLQASAVTNKIGKESADATFKNELVPVIKEFADTFFSGDMHADEKAEAMLEPQNLQLMHHMGSLIMAYAFDVELATPPNKEVDEDGYASEDEDEALPKGMVPMADMLNADADRNNARLFYEEDSLSMKALKPIKSGEEIFNDYGPLPRSDLLRRYGYITENYAQYDVVEIPRDLVIRNVELFATEPFEDRFDYLEEQGVLDEGFDITSTHNFDIEESMPELVVTVQALLIAKEDFARLQRKDKLPRPDTIEAKSLQCLKNIVRERVEQYQTTLEDDTRDPVIIPQGGDSASKERRYAMAKIVRIGEKRILQQAGNALTALIQDFASTGGVKRGREETNNTAGKRQRTG